MEPITVISCAARFAPNVLEVVGVIEGVAAKLDKLSRAELNAAMRALKQAAQSEREAVSLLREARGRFNKAIDLEGSDPIRLATAYLGLALCHLHLGDHRNAEAALEQLEELSLEDDARNLRYERRKGAIVGFLHPAGAVMAGIAQVRLWSLQVKIDRLNEIKESGIKLASQTKET